MTSSSTRPEIKVSEGISTLILLTFMLLSVTGSVVAADWTDGLGVVTWSALGGLAFGFLVAKTRLPGWFTHLVMLVLAVPVTGLVVGLVLPRALTLEEKFFILQERILIWTRRVIAGGTSSDSLIFVVQLALILWIIGYVAAWFVYRRHQVWGAILPAGISITLNLFYSAPQSGLYFGLFVTTVLLLIVRLNLLAMERVWRSESIGYAPDISFDFLMYGVAFSLLLILIAWIVPATAPGPSWFAILDPLQTPWQGVEDQFNRVFSALRGVGRQAPSSFYGTTLTMSGPVKLGNRPVMDVQTNYGRYWRAAVYDRYINIGWLNTRLDSLTLAPNDPKLVTLSGVLRIEVTQTVKVYLPDQNVLIAAAQPQRFSLPTEIRYGQPASTESDSAMMDVALVRARKTIREGEVYSVVSAISVADEKSLRLDAINYSRWISATYLQLPDELPQRVRTLAHEITDKYSNPYDKAAALEHYLRTNIVYNENISAPPPGHDGVDYFLFDRQEGYCNYYASAMVVMARVVGIPARIASGYSLGEYSNGTFHVIESSAHSWPEIYFPTYGWIEFEPTGNQPGIIRPVYAENDAPPNLDENLASRQRFNRDDQEKEDAGESRGARSSTNTFTLPSVNDLVLWGGGLATLIALGVLLGWFVLDARHQARMSPAARVYEAMLTRARWLGVRAQKFATPLEHAHALADAMPSAREATEQIAALYTRERYAAQTLESDERAALESAWSIVRETWFDVYVANLVAKIRAPFSALRVRLEKFKSAPPNHEPES